MPDPDDKKVKDLLDAATQRELENWFKLPSFDQVAARVEEDPELVEVRERRLKACAAVDPVLLELIRVRTEVVPETLLHNDFFIRINADPSIAQFDNDMAERGHQLAEPREVEIQEELRDDLKECTPQALLRDLHRTELYFEKLFEVVDVAAEQKLDIVAEVDAAMKMNLKLPPLGRSPFEEESRLLADDRSTRRKPWTELRQTGGQA
jgi:hypothetical protein